MEIINNTTKTLRDDLKNELKRGSKLSIAAACFSIYAFQELKQELLGIDELRFIFTSPTFTTEKVKKEKREFYIPRLNRERSLYGTEFEVKLRNELTQKAIAKECAEWIKNKVTFKSNTSDKSIQGQIVVDGIGYTPINNFTTVEWGVNSWWKPCISRKAGKTWKRDCTAWKTSSSRKTAEEKVWTCFKGQNDEKWTWFAKCSESKNTDKRSR